MSIHEFSLRESQYSANQHHHLHAKKEDETKMCPFKHNCHFLFINLVNFIKMTVDSDDGNTMYVILCGFMETNGILNDHMKRLDLDDIKWDKD